ncbi:MAG: hypothetical protein PSX79_05605 [bacterium]|nr:hypothetical protein [Alphaproteobacteria bacterium]MDI1364333.1 hypothetical protein [bacterium]
MVPTDATTEIRLDGSDDADRFSTFVRSFLSANGFPFVIIHDAPERAGQLRRVVFEDAKVSAKFASEWLRLRGTAGQA